MYRIYVFVNRRYVVLNVLDWNMAETRYSLRLKISVNDICVNQIFSSLVRFVENIDKFISLNKFIMKIDFIIHLMILTMYYKY